MIDPTLFDIRRLITEVLDADSHTQAYRWRNDCEIIPDYMPPFPSKTTRPTCVVRHIPTNVFLRFMAGPRQGFFWDVYGEDFQSPELALVALSQAPTPPAGPLYQTFTLRLPRDTGQTP